MYTVSAAYIPRVCRRFLPPFFSDSCLSQIGYNIFLSFLGNKKAPEDGESGVAELKKFTEDIKDEAKYGADQVNFGRVCLGV